MKKLVAFGDIHLDWQAVGVILDEARNLGIDTALTLGDEDSFAGAQPWVYDRIYGALRDFRDEKPGRELICCIGDKTSGVKRYLCENYVGVDAHGKKVGSIVFRRGNVIAAHNGGWVLRKRRKYIESYSGAKPLVIFHGHSHSMGVLPEYKWLREEEFVRSIPDGEKIFHLEPSKVYWVNPGASVYGFYGEPGKANFVIYDPTNQTVELRTKEFKRRSR